MLTETELYDISEKISSLGIPVHYQLTEGELYWLRFIRGCYSIADYLNSRMLPDGRTVLLDSDLSKALDEDCKGAGKAVCLSDDSDLQAIFFYSYEES